MTQVEFKGQKVQKKKPPIAPMISGFIYAAREEGASSEILANVERNESATVGRLSNVSVMF